MQFLLLLLLLLSHLYNHIIIGVPSFVFVPLSVIWIQIDVAEKIILLNMVRKSKNITSDILYMYYFGM